ncbi:MAG: UbiD family decarboxylase [Thaumarchaeota archaeon]|nr:UbiD family decarboxylase [Nitrososphaerota archaeon]
MADLRSYLAELRAARALQRFRGPVSARHEIAAETARLEGSSAALFEDVRGSRIRLVSNLVGTRARFAMAIGAKEAAIHRRIFAASRAARTPAVSSRTPPFERNSARTLSALPIVRHFAKEPGPFITASTVHAKNPETGEQNMSFHRIMPISARRATIRMVEGRHLDRCFAEARERGEDLRVAVTVGVHPAVLIAGAYQAEWGKAELTMANALLRGGLELSRRDYSGLLVPSHAEVVIDGRILRDVTHEEWMVEMLRTYDHKRRQPVLEVDRIWHRDSAIYHDILSGYGEHRLLMGMPAESKVDGRLRAAFPSAVRAVSLTGGGCNWLHAAVAIKRTRATRVERIIDETFAAHRSLKQVTIVDDDIDVNSAESIEYAMATRFQADRDLRVVRNVRGSSLDPSSDQARLRTAKLGIDATRPPSKRPEGFEIARIPGLG